jgi:outer membrane autotransporter protein
MLADDPVSALVIDRTDRNTQIGVWGRGSAGDLNQDLTTTFASPGGTIAVTQRVHTSYHILQSGLDFGMMGIGGDFNLHVGITGGRYAASSKIPGGETEVDTDFLGGYMAITGKGLRIDGTYRREWRDFTLQNTSLIASGQATTKDGAWVGAVNASYKLDFGGFYIKPAVGYSFGSSKIDPFAIDALTTVTPRDDKTGMLRFGGTLGWEGQVSSNLIMSPYVGVFGLHNASNTEATDLVFGTTALPTETIGFKNTMQVVAGLDMHHPENKIGAFTRASFYTSNGVTGASFSVGARINF